MDLRLHFAAFRLAGFGVGRASAVVRLLQLAFWLGHLDSLQSGRRPVSDRVPDESSKLTAQVEAEKSGFGPE